jgi:hypothetical protein
MTRSGTLAVCAAVAFAIASYAALTVVEAQEQSPASATPPSDAPKADPAVQSPTDMPGCKGLAEKPCRTNKACVWIIPKEADKNGVVRPAYCHKKGKKAQPGKATDTPAPTAPASEQNPPSGAPPN